MTLLILLTCSVFAEFKEYVDTRRLDPNGRSSGIVGCIHIVDMNTGWEVFYKEIATSTGYYLKDKYLVIFNDFNNIGKFNYCGDFYDLSDVRNIKINRAVHTQNLYKGLNSSNAKPFWTFRKLNQQIGNDMITTWLPIKNESDKVLKKYPTNSIEYAIIAYNINFVLHECARLSNAEDIIRITDVFFEEKIVKGNFASIAIYKKYGTFGYLLRKKSDGNWMVIGNTDNGDGEYKNEKFIFQDSYPPNQKMIDAIKKFPEKWVYKKFK